MIIKIEMRKESKEKEIKIELMKERGIKVTEIEEITEIKVKSEDLEVDQEKTEDVNKKEDESPLDHHHHLQALTHQDRPLHHPHHLVPQINLLTLKLCNKKMHQAKKSRND